jgi:polysaccharide biosynthesis PFTS motif protein
MPFKRFSKVSVARAYLTTFRDVRQNEGETEILRLLDEMQDKVSYHDDWFNRFLFGKFVSSSLKSVLTQKLMQEHYDSGLSNHVMLARGRFSGVVVLPYHKKWRRYLEHKGLRVGAGSFLLYGLRVALRLKSALGYFLRLARYTNPVLAKQENCTIHVGFPPTSYQKSTSAKAQDNYLSYLRNNAPSETHCFLGRLNDQLGDKLFEIPFPVLPLRTTLQRIKFVYVNSLLFMKLLLCCIIRRSYMVYLANDLLLMNHIKCNDINALPKRVVFSNSHFGYQPVWARFLESKGGDVLLQFYSMNTFDVKFHRGSMGLIPGYRYMTWSKYRTSHPNHASLIRDIVKCPVDVEVDPEPLPFVDSSEDLDLPKGPRVALFDVQPYKDSFMTRIGRPSNIFNYQVSAAFISDIFEWCQKNHVYMILKPKRDIGNKLCPKYASLVKRISESSKLFVVVNSQHSAKRICLESDIVISQPFTTPAYTATLAGKPAVYYDSSKIIDPDQPAALGVSVINDKSRLHKWLDEQLESIKSSVV